MVPLITSRRKKCSPGRATFCKKNRITVIVIANEKNDESFGNATEWYREKIKYL